MPVVVVEMWAGRTAAQKKQIAAGITAVFTGMGVAPDAVTVILKDNAKRNWATGGKLADET